MKIIDAHVHYSRIQSFKDCAEQTSMTDYSGQGFANESLTYEILQSVCMGLTETVPGGFPDINAGTPMLTDLEVSPPPSMSICPGINPHTLSDKSLAITENAIKNNKGIVGLKIYAGYYHVDITDPVYFPVYNLAEKYDITIVIHTGETFSERGLLKYSHPLRVDELAVARPEMRIVACHMGAPWVFDACEVVGKNSNVYLDISGMLVGNAEYINLQASHPLIVDRYRQALVFLNRYDKVLYGSDWPLVPMGAYIEFCKKLIPEDSHENVFYNNALKVFKLEGLLQDS